MAVIPLKAVVRPLPEIGFFIRENFKPIADLKLCGLIKPVEICWYGRMLEFFDELHHFSPFIIYYERLKLITKILLNRLY